jgi:signal transduction histidine kinase
MNSYIHVSLRYTSSEVVLSVKDSGVGIPTSDIGLIGERFHRVQSVSRSHEGTGIGLALVKVRPSYDSHETGRKLTEQELIKLHGGSLHIDSVTAQESPDGSRMSSILQ